MGDIGERILEAEGGGAAELVKLRAVEAMKDSNLEQVFKAAGISENPEMAATTLKMVLAEQLAKYAMDAKRVADQRKMKFGAAAIIIAAQKA